jgi:hypothetical protein
MNAKLGAHTRVHIMTEQNKIRFYLAKIESARREDTKTIFLQGTWNDDPQKSTAFAYETANIIRRRLKQESYIDTRIALTAGNIAEIIDEGDLKW